MIQVVDDKEIIYQHYARKYLPLHIYEIGDLDDFFFPRTKFVMYSFSVTNEENLNVIDFLAMFYQAPGLTVFLAFGGDEEEINYGRLFLHEYMENLPNSFYAHMSPGLASPLSEYYEFDHHGLFSKMAITDFKSSKELVDECLRKGSEIPEQLNTLHLNEILEFYQEAYPGNWFDPQMLETGQTFGIFCKDDHKLVAIAGIHVYSPQYRVCSLGNIATHPKFRGKGYGKLVTASLIQSLMNSNLIDVIGLNVKANNSIAIRCYESLGFQFIANYEEIMLNKKVHVD